MVKPRCSVLQMLLVVNVVSHRMFALVLFILFCLLSVAYVLLSRRYAYWKKRGVPFPKPTFVFGNTGGALLLTARLSEIFTNIYNDYKGYAYVGMFNLWHPAILICDTELIKEVLIKQFNNFHDNWIAIEEDVDPIVSDNPFVLRGNKWKTTRSQLTAQFTSSKIKSMYPLIQEGCKNMLNYIKKETRSKSGNDFELKELCARFTGDNVVSCAYGLDGKSFEVPHPDCFKIGEQISSSSKIVQLKQTLGLFFKLMRKLFKITFLGDPVPKMFSDMILESVKYREKNNVSRTDYLGFLKELKDKPTNFEMSSNQLVAHAFTYFLDGFETTGLAFCYALYELSLHPKVQKNAREDIEKALKKHNGSITYESVQEMEYIENIIFETLRKHPIIAFISRICTEEFVLPPPEGSLTGKEVTVEKNTQVFIPVLGIHNDPKNYRNPNGFEPDHFKPENVRPNCSFLGFGDGPRICLGKKFALAQLKLGLVTILSNFELKLNTKTKLPLVEDNNHVFSSPKDGVWIDFYPHS